MRMFLWFMLIIQVLNGAAYIWWLGLNAYPRKPQERTPLEDALGLVGRLCFALWAAYLLWG